MSDMKFDYSIIFSSLEALEADPSTKEIFETGKLTSSVRQEVEELRKFVSDKTAEDQDSVYTRT